MAKERIRKQPGVTPFNYKRYKSGSPAGNIYPLQNEIAKGWGVTSQNVRRQTNGMMVNQLGEQIKFYIEEIELDFELAGTTGQSRTLRQFFPHNMVQPSIKVRGRCPNSFQYMELGAFIRASQMLALQERRVANSGADFRNEIVPDATGKRSSVYSQTTKLVILPGSQKNKNFPYNGRNVKGRHNTLQFEGYVKAMTTGARRFDHAPQFEFEFFIAETTQSAPQGIGFWNDTRVYGSQILPWMQIFKSRGAKGFVRDPRDDDPGFSRSDYPTLGSALEAVFDAFSDAIDDVVEDSSGFLGIDTDDEDE